MIESLLQLLAPISCVYCGEPRTLLCEGHLRVAMTFESISGLEGYYAVELDEPMLAALSAFKDRSMTALAPIFAAVLEPLLSTQSWQSAELVVIPPSSAKAYRSRGFVPVKLVLRNSKNRLPVMQLGRKRRVSDQRGLDANQRRANLENAFSSTALLGKRVVLFDDVLTTSATLQEMRRAVELAGAQVTGFCVLARRFMDSPIKPAK